MRTKAQPPVQPPQNRVDLNPAPMARASLPSALLSAADARRADAGVHDQGADRQALAAAQCDGRIRSDRSPCADTDIADYFNYGFDEASWNEYANKQKLMREAASASRRAVVCQTCVHCACSCCVAAPHALRCPARCVAMAEAGGADDAQGSPCGRPSRLAARPGHT